jgi:chromosome segregation ATPase
LQADTLRERDAEKVKFDAEKKKLEEELARVRELLKKAAAESALTESKQKEMGKLSVDRDRIAKELLDCRNDLENSRKQIKTKEEDGRRKDAEFAQNREAMKLVLIERDDVKKERDELETKVTQTLRRRSAIVNECKDALVAACGAMSSRPRSLPAHGHGRCRIGGPSPNLYLLHTRLAGR